MVRSVGFRLLYRVVFVCFCLIFVCFYPYGGGSGYDSQEDNTESNKLKEEFKGKSLNDDVFIKQDEYVPNLTENAKQVDGGEAWKKTDLSKMGRKESVMKTLRNDRIRKSSKLSSSTSSPSEVKVPGKESTAISHSSEVKPQNNDGKHATSLEKLFSYQNGSEGTIKRENFASLTTQHHRSRRDIDAVSESERSLPVCANFTFTIKYEDEYKVWNNFSMMYQDQEYWRDEYRVTNYGLQVCISSDPLVQERWWEFIAWEKELMASNHCNDSVDGFYHENYTLFKNMTVFFQPTGQTFTRQEYGVIFGYFAICSTKLSFSCNDDLVNVKNNAQYQVFNDLSLFYNNTTYDYREYRFKNDSLEMCASKDSRVQTIWRTRNSWEKFKDVYKCRRDSYHFRHYAVSKQFTVYSAHNSQHIIRHDYAVKYGKPTICKEKIRPESTDYTQQDLLMCNDSIINIHYNDEYKIWTNFSILYKNKMYDYTKYRVLNDSVKICNSTDNDVRNIWKLRNYWVKAFMHYKSCRKPTLQGEVLQEKYAVLKDFRILIFEPKQIISKYDYGVFEGRLIICLEKLLPLLSLYLIKELHIACLCALALSLISLLLLLIVYCMLPELRTLPGLNLMSLGFAFLLCLICYVVMLALRLHTGKLFVFSCNLAVVIFQFVLHSILSNAAVNVYHLKKTFCGNTLVKSDESKWKRFLKYSLFSWGVPVIITIVYGVLIEVGVLRYDHVFSVGCVIGNNFPDWLVVVEHYGLPGCFMLFIIVTFIFTAYQIRKKLKASSSIAQKSNIVKNRNNFVMLLKLSTVTAISVFPLIFVNHQLSLNRYITTTFVIVACLSGFYIGIAFVFTKKNYQLLKKKYFPAKKTPVNAT